jgi:hypothetical protein
LTFAWPRLAGESGGIRSVRVEELRVIERRLRDGADSGTDGGGKRERRDDFCVFGVDGWSAGGNSVDRLIGCIRESLSGGLKVSFSTNNFSVKVETELYLTSSNAAVTDASWVDNSLT